MNANSFDNLPGFSLRRLGKLEALTLADPRGRAGACAVRTHNPFVYPLVPLSVFSSPPDIFMEKPGNGL